MLVGFVADVLEDGQFPVGDQTRDLLDQFAFLHLVGDFRYDELPLAAAQPLDPRIAVLRLIGFGCVEASAKAEGAAPGLVGAGDRVRAVYDQASGGEVRAVEQFHQTRVLDVRIIDELQRRIDHLGNVVRGDVRRHADRDPARSIGEQVGEQPRHQLGLFLLSVIGRDEIDGPCIQAVHQAHRGLRQARLGITVSRRVIAIDIAEVPLPLDQRVAQREILREADHRIVSGGIAMRMVLADHLAHHAGRLLECLAGIQLQLAHRPKQAAVDRLQSVAQVRQAARRDRREGIDQIPFGQSAVEGSVDDRIESVVALAGAICVRFVLR